MAEADPETWFHKKLIKGRHKDVDPLECPAVNRLQILLEHYHEYIETKSINNTTNRGMGMYSYLSRSLQNYSVVRLMDDYHHVLRKYFNQLTVVHQILTQNISYDISSSVIFKRIHRNRQRCALRNDERCEYFGGYNASDEVSVQKLMDKIYSHLILSFDAGYMLSQSEILQIAAKQIEDTQDIYNTFISSNTQKKKQEKEKKEDEDYAIDSPLQTIVDITREKSKLLYRIRGENRMKYNKFVTHLDSQQDVKQEEDEERVRYDINFGFHFKYWPSYKVNKWYIAKKYVNLKSEMTRNKICQISDKQFEDEIKNAIAYIHCRRGRKLRCKYLSNYNEVTENEVGIATNTPISIDHMLALMIFSSYDIMRKHIVSVYRKKINVSESDAALKQRHCEYANICRLLYEGIRLYGTDIGKYDGFQMTFYHCYSSLVYFDEFHAYFSYPTSTTSSLSVINTYCPSDKGLILQLRKDIEYEGDQHYMDCSWFSDFGVESEKLFLNIMLSFKAILYPALYHNYGQYLNAFTALQSMVIGTELNQDIITPLVPKFLKQMIDKKLKCVPQYMFNTFSSFREIIDSIQINVWLMIIDSYEIMDDITTADTYNNNNNNNNNNVNNERYINDGNQYGFLKLHSLFIASDGWIYIDRLATLFPNTTHIELYNGNIQTAQILPCMTLDESTMNNLLNVLPEIIASDSKLTKISFYYPDEGILDIESIIKIFQRWFHQIKWNIKISMQLAPFLPDRTEPVRTLIVHKQ